MPNLDNKKIFLVTGASGLVGRKITKDLLPFAKKIYAVSRNINSLQATQKIKIIRIESLDDLANNKKILSNVDVLIHTAAAKEKFINQLIRPQDYFNINFKSTLNLANQANRFGVKRFIFLSSIKVNGETSNPNKPFNSKSKPNPRTIYAKSKFYAEQDLIKLSRISKMEIVILRPPSVYGLDSKNFLALLGGLIKLRIPLPFLLLNNKRSFISIENLSSVIVNCSFNPNAKSKILLVSDNYDIRMLDLLNLIANFSNKKIFLFKFPSIYFKIIFNFLGLNFIYQRIFCSLEVNIKDTITILGWEPPHKFKPSLKKIFKQN